MCGSDARGKLAGGAQVAFAMPAGLPQVSHAGDISDLSGGVGSDESTAIKGEMSHYPFVLEFAGKANASNDYLADIPVQISDARGDVLLNAVASHEATIPNSDDWFFTLSILILDHDVIYIQCQLLALGGWIVRLMKRPEGEALTKQDFEALSDFRYQLRRFLRFSEKVVQAEGITPLQYLLLLHIKGFPGRDWATVGELAERLQAAPHGAVALVSRCEAAGLVERRPSDDDHRRVEVRLLEQGERCLAQLAALHKSELRSSGRTFKIPHSHARDVAHADGPFDARFRR